MKKSFSFLAFVFCLSIVTSIGQPSFPLAPDHVGPMATPYMASLNYYGTNSASVANFIGAVTNGNTNVTYVITNDLRVVSLANSGNSFSGSSFSGGSFSGSSALFDTSNNRTNIYGGAVTKLGLSVYEGIFTLATNISHAEGGTTLAGGAYSHAEGQNNTALGAAAHVEGSFNNVNGDSSHGAGRGVQVTNDNAWAWSDGTTFGSMTNQSFGAYALKGFRFIGGTANFSSVNTTNPIFWSNVTLSAFPAYVYTTNIIGINNAGVSKAIGTYTNIAIGIWTNMAFNGSAIVFQNPTYFLQTNNVNLYSTTNPMPNSTWLLVLGATTVPSQSGFGYIFNHNGILDNNLNTVGQNSYFNTNFGVHVGDGSGLTGIIYSNNAGIFNGIFQNLPFVSVTTNGFEDGVTTFTNLQHAIDFFCKTNWPLIGIGGGGSSYSASFGGTIIVGNGEFYYPTGLVIRATHPMSLSIKGQGMWPTLITANSNVFTIPNSGIPNMLNLKFENMAVACYSNVPGAIFQTVQNPALHDVELRSVWIGQILGSVTNYAQNPLWVPSTILTPLGMNGAALRVSDNIKLYDCMFVGLANGLISISDHIRAYNNQWACIGVLTSNYVVFAYNTNLWSRSDQNQYYNNTVGPVGEELSFGAAFVLESSADSDIGGSHFFQCGLGYKFGISLDNGYGIPTIHDDHYESCIYSYGVPDDMTALVNLYNNYNAGGLIWEFIACNDTVGPPATLTTNQPVLNIANISEILRTGSSFTYLVGNTNVGSFSSVGVSGNGLNLSNIQSSKILTNGGTAGQMLTVIDSGNVQWTNAVIGTRIYGSIAKTNYIDFSPTGDLRTNTISGNAELLNGNGLTLNTSNAITKVSYAITNNGAKIISFTNVLFLDTNSVPLFTLNGIPIALTSITNQFASTNWVGQNFALQGSFSVPASATNQVVFTNDTRSINLTGLVTLTNGGNLISGDGSGLTNLNANNLVGAVTNAVSDILITTNLVMGTFYTNLYGVSIQVQHVAAVPTVALVAGNVSLALEISGIGTNAAWSAPTAIGVGIAGAETNDIYTFVVPTNAIFRFVDTSAGAGNSVALALGSQILERGAFSTITGISYLSITNPFNSFNSILNTNFTMTGATVVTNASQPSLTGVTLFITNSTPHSFQVVLNASGGSFVAATNVFHVNYNCTFPIAPNPQWSPANINTMNLNIYRQGFNNQTTTGFDFFTSGFTYSTAVVYIYNFEVNY